MLGYSVISQHLDGKRKPIGEGYYFIKDNKVHYTKEIAEGKIIGLKELEDVIYEGFKNILDEFINSEDNKDVYGLSLSTSEYYDLLMYINNEDYFKENLERYIQKYPDYKEPKREKSLKMNLGDFKLMLSCEDGLKDKYLQVMKLFQSINYHINNDDGLYIKGITDYSYIFEGTLFDNSLYSIVVNVFNKLKSEFINLNTTDKFISYPSAGDDYVDYDLLIRKHCEKELFYELFDVKKNDDEFNEYKKSLEGLSNNELFEALSKECIEKTHRTNNIFSRTIRTEYAGVKILEEKLTVKDSIEVLKVLIHQSTKENSNGLRTKIFFIGCVLINQSCNNEIPVNEIENLVQELGYEDEGLKEIIHYLKVM